jgi:hypothetical protein
MKLVNKHSLERLQSGTALMQPSIALFTLYPFDIRVTFLHNYSKYVLTVMRTSASVNAMSLSAGDSLSLSAFCCSAAYTKHTGASHGSIESLDVDARFFRVIPL